MRKTNPSLSNAVLATFARCIVVLAMALFALAALASAQCTGVSNSTTGAITWTPQFCQEFNGTALTPLDTTVWSFDLGNNGGWGNGEAEVYCGPPGYGGNSPLCAASLSTSTNNAYIDGSGHLIIQAINNSGTWTSTRMKTEGIENFKYGRIEGSIQLPDTTNSGMWPAFWSLGSSIQSGVSWPTCGEADIMEVWSHTVLNGPGPTGNKSTIHTALTGGNGTGGSYTFASGANNTALHAYGVIWSANMMEYYVDTPTQPFFITTTSNLSSGDTWPFNANIFILLNLAIGGTLGGSTSGLASPTQPYIVDYVRQYTPSAVPAPVLGNPPSITVKAGATTGNTSTFTPGLTSGTGYAFFNCSTNAPKASCAINTTDTVNTFVVNSNNPSESVKVTITTTANTWLPPYLFRPRKWNPWLVTALAALLLAALLLFLRSKRAVGRASYGAAFACMVFAAIMVASSGGCGSSAGGGGGGGGGGNGTTPGSYNIIVNAFTESNTSGTTPDSTVTIPLTVN